MAKINLIIPHLDKDDPEVFTKLESFLVELVKQNQTNDLVDEAVTSAKRTGIDVKVGSFTCPAATGNKSVTGVGFKPRFVDFIIGRDLDEQDRAGTGWMDYNGFQGCACWAGGDDLQTSKVETAMCFRIYTEGTNDAVRAIYGSMDTDGFTIDFKVVNITYTILWRAVR